LQPARKGKVGIYGVVWAFALASCSLSLPSYRLGLLRSNGSSSPDPDLTFRWCHLRYHRFRAINE
jgi:hypothetical protein